MSRPISDLSRTQRDTIAPRCAGLFEFLESAGRDTKLTKQGYRTFLRETTELPEVPNKKAAKAKIRDFKDGYASRLNNAYMQNVISPDRAVCVALAGARRAMGG